MTVNSFNNKVNLYKFCQKRGVKVFDVVKLPNFGWFCINSDRSLIRGIADFAESEEEMIDIIRYICLDNKELLDFPINYSSVMESKIVKDFSYHRMWKSFWHEANQAFETRRMRLGANKEAALKPFLKTQMGWIGVDDLKMGAVNTSILQKYSRLGLPPSVSGKLIIPSFYTPQHISSLHTIIPQTTEMHTIYKNGERGWFGDLKGKLVGNVDNIAKFGGFTWEAKVDHWLPFNDKPTELHYTVSPEEAVKIWREAKSSEFDMLLTDRVDEVADESIEGVRQVTTKFQLSEVKELSDALPRLGILEYWRKAQTDEILLGGKLRVVREAEGYAIFNAEGEKEIVTNFTVDILRLTLKGKKHFREGHINVNGASFPFEFPEDCFDSSKRLYSAIKAHFLRCGIGIPMILPRGRGILLDAINIFNQHRLNDIDKVTDEELEARSEESVQPASERTPA